MSTEYNNFEEWYKSLENMDFEYSSKAIRDKILESPEVTDLFRKQFIDCFDYVTKLYKSNKALEPNLIKIYLEQVCGYKETLKMVDFMRILMLLSYCGFSFTLN